MDENEKTLEERFNEMDFSKDYPDNEFLSKIERICSELYLQFNKKEYSSLQIAQKRNGYEYLVKEKLKILNLKEKDSHSIFISKLIEKYKLKIIESE